uniref:Crossover junction endonuclease MUS81 n=1 Tax=Sphenodon punctatus TaxID=8508 RepID=A0A8D0GMI4_SPHPU
MLDLYHHRREGWLFSPSTPSYKNVLPDQGAGGHCWRREPETVALCLVALRALPEAACPLPPPGQLQPPAPRELALGYVVERKRMADLCSSIIDGRFREQKFRLHQCGLQHPIYLVEDSGTIQHLSLPESTLQQAVINTQVVDGFFVKRTRDVRESAAYLTVMTRHLDRLFGVSSRERSWGEPRESGTETLPPPISVIPPQAQTVREVFARQLMQVSGVSGDKAAAILERYSTPASLLAAYAACLSPQDKEMLLSNTKCGKLQRNLGPTLSKTLAQLYCTPGPLP